VDSLVTTTSDASIAPALTDSREEQFRIEGDPKSLTLFLRHLPAANGGMHALGRTVLFVHGATFPSALAAAYKFGGRSWMDELAAAGFDVWALDFPGYGGSSRYPEMDEPPLSHDALGRAPECARQVGSAVEFIRKHQEIERVSIIAHSWGTMAAGLFASDHQDRLDRLVFFGPIAIRHNGVPQRSPAWRYITSEYQWNRFQAEAPKGLQPVFPHQEYDPWIAAYLATDPSSEDRTPPSVKVPTGPFADIAAAWSGSLPYDPSRIVGPVLLVRGEWDAVSSAEDVTWLLYALTNAAEKEAVTLDRGTHVMHLESGRTRLYRVVESFLSMQARER